MYSPWSVGPGDHGVRFRGNGYAQPEVRLPGVEYFKGPFRLRATLWVRRLEKNTEALTANTKELQRFNENMEDVLEAVQGMMPVLEGAAAGSSAIKMGVEMFKGLWSARQARRSN